MNLNLDNIMPVFVFFLIIVGYLIVLMRSRRKSKESDLEWKRRLDPNSMSIVKKKESEVTLLKTGAISPDTYFKSKIPKVEGLQEWIQHAGLEMSPLIFVMGSAFLGMVIGIVFFVLLHGEILISVLIGIVSAFFFPSVLVVYLAKRRRTAFLSEFPIALDIIRRALRVGHSTDRALAMVAEQEMGLVGQTFQSLTEKMQLGTPMEIALAEVANRLGIEEFRMLAIILILQRETGGSFAEVTDNFANIIRARENLRKKVKSLTAEVRVTAIILTSIPIFTFGAIYVTSPSYFNPLFYTDKGNTLLLFGGAMLFSGVAIIMKMAYKEYY